MLLLTIIIISAIVCNGWWHHFCFTSTLMATVAGRTFTVPSPPLSLDLHCSRTSTVLGRLMFHQLQLKSPQLSQGPPLLQDLQCLRTSSLTGHPLSYGSDMTVPDPLKKYKNSREPKREGQDSLCHPSHGMDEDLLSQNRLAFYMLKA